MKIHHEGYLTILIVAVFVAAMLFCLFFFIPRMHWIIKALLLIAGLGFFTFVTRFFRVPYRVINKVETGVVSPADGTIIAIEEEIEKEYFKDQRIRISIFMSPNNVHVNSYPIDGKVSYVCYHPGKYLVARLPKASTDNEHNTVVIRKNEREEVLFRQIAGFVARRIVCYAKEGEEAMQGEEMGMIKFGSRVDVFVPVDSQISVKIGDKVTSKKTVLSYF
jgi:phosphatidylserine decarboxylase